MSSTTADLERLLDEQDKEIAGLEELTSRLDTLVRGPHPGPPCGNDKVPQPREGLLGITHRLQGQRERRGEQFKRIISLIG